MNSCESHIYGTATSQIPASPRHPLRWVAYQHAGLGWALPANLNGSTLSSRCVRYDITLHAQQDQPAHVLWPVWRATIVDVQRHRALACRGAGLLQAASRCELSTKQPLARAPVPLEQWITSRLTRVFGAKVG